MKPVENRPASSRNELKTFEIGPSGRNRLDFGTVRPRVQIPGPRPISDLEFISVAELTWQYGYIDVVRM